jgi:hypothetical protein
MKSNKRVNKSSKGKGRTKSLYTNFAKPSYGQKVQTAARDTLNTYVQMNSTLGANGFNYQVNWPSLQGGSQQADKYRYFEVTGWRIDVTLPSVTATLDSFYNGSAAILPVNYVIDNFTTTVPTDSRQVLQLPGAVNVKEGVSNTGKWFPPPCKQVYPTMIFASGGLRPAFALVGYLNDIGLNETALVVEVYCDVIFYGQQLELSSITVLKFGLNSESADSDTEEITSLSKVSVPVQGKPKKR